MDIRRRDLPGITFFFFGVCLLFLIGSPITSSAQPLDKGDIAFTGFNADAHSDFAVVALQDITAHTTTFLNVSSRHDAYRFSVKLSPAHSTAINTEVAFLSGAGSAAGSDIDGNTVQNILFRSSDPSGTTKSIAVQIHNDSKFKGNKTAIFRLQSNSAGTIIKPNVFNLTIRDDSVPVIINEILADPPSGITGDANDDGTRDSSDDEFLELVNTGSHKIDISGWKLSDDGGATIRHVFPAGTVLNSKQAIVVFSGGNPEGAFGGAIVQTASSGSLSLNNSGDIPALLDENGNIVQKIAYGGQWGSSDRDANENQSITRAPDYKSHTWEKHSTVTGSEGALFSPGTKVDGTSFGGGYATTFRGKEGWRFIAAPAQNTSFKDLLGNLWIQGIPNSDAPSVNPANANIRSWDESNAEFQAISSMNDNIIPGKGYIVYVYQDDNLDSPGIQGGFPKIISADNTENETVNVAVHSQDANENGLIDEYEGWNLLGNPFGTNISVSKVLDALDDINSNLNRNVYIWNPDKGNGNGGYETISTGTIAPFQAFFIRYTQKGVSGNANFNRSALAANHRTDYLRKVRMPSTAAMFKLFLGNGHQFDTYDVRFKKGAKISEDLSDAYKLFSLNPDAIELFSTVGNGVKLAKNVLPPLHSLKGNVHIPLTVNVPASGQYKFRWSDISNLPGRLKLFLVDHKTNRKVNLATAGNYQFRITKQSRPEDKKTDKNSIDPPAISGKTAGNTVTNIRSRFELVLDASSSNPGRDIGDPDVRKTKLFPNYPNPFSSQTTIKFQLKKKNQVSIVIYNIVGQKIATVVEGKMMTAGIQQVRWQPSANLPSGVYICWIKAGDKILTQKMTCIK